MEDEDVCCCVVSLRHSKINVWTRFVFFFSSNECVYVFVSGMDVKLIEIFVFFIILPFLEPLHVVLVYLFITILVHSKSSKLYVHFAYTFDIYIHIIYYLYNIKL